ncbi:MAG: hypothetical protein AVDCRST_MAG65-830 [uncultured Solirubrobacteraceae bacterium]|uniref:Integral membrane protein n=1 Tax=uncultured Solirubrobacteraceae bacterium TaxID=1162706 RepID=A0A6J4RGC7_9ACTN|nr:MAG: hypothetical protein AVDCRST_MAG65-830 [uncultured Solirubrobacteraceae bacterium]
MSAHDSDIGAVPAGAASGGGGAASGDTLPPEDLRERSLPELVKQLTDQSTTLIKQEIDLAKAEIGETIDTAKAEMTQKAKDAGKGAGMLGAAGVIGLLAAIAFTAFLILVLATFLPDWVAALIVTVLYAAIAAVLALRGKKQLQEIEPAPKQTIATAKDAQKQSIESVKEDIEWAKTQSRSAKK